MTTIVKRSLSQRFNDFLDAIANSKFAKARERAARAAVSRHIGDQTYRELSRLSDRELADIGIHRGQIYDIAYNRNV